ncbi:hypothetical protein HMPREF0497_0162 [Lentilactobacillus buchneri ATCC 11577]|nr:hypothetical protein HMPREF0497_0162 [Lentilactobacillus buchneri ATCC 11577]
MAQFVFVTSLFFYIQTDFLTAMHHLLLRQFRQVDWHIWRY